MVVVLHSARPRGCGVAFTALAEQPMLHTMSCQPPTPPPASPKCFRCCLPVLAMRAGYSCPVELSCGSTYPEVHEKCPGVSIHAVNERLSRKKLSDRLNLPRLAGGQDAHTAGMNPSEVS